MLLCLLTLLPHQASAQLAVADAPVLAAVGSVLTALKSMLDETRRMMADLTSWAEVQQRVHAASALIAEVETVMGDIGVVDEGWSVLSTSGRALCTVAEAVSWKTQALQWQQEGFGVSRKAKGLVGRGFAFLTNLQIVLTGLSGPTAGAQSQSGLLALIASQIAQLQGLQAGFQTATIGKDEIASVLAIQSICLQQGAYATWGSYSR